MKIFRRTTRLILTVMFVLVFAQTAFAEADFQVSFDVEYGQTEARSMLSLINELRTGDDAWAWNEDDSEKVYYTGLGELEYDYELEEAAMLRAAELVLSFSHTRPNGGNAFDLYKFSAAGENIAAGQKSAEAAFTAWAEENSSYSGQGHRRNMLSSNFGAIGIGHAIYGGTHFWVQVFRESNKGGSDPGAVDTTTTVIIEVDEAYISSATVSCDDSPVTVAAGGSASLPGISASLKMVSGFIGAVDVDVTGADWSSADASVAAVSDGKLKGVSVGSTQITANALGESVTASVSVTESTGTSDDESYEADEGTDADSSTVDTDEDEEDDYEYEDYYDEDEYEDDDDDGEYSSDYDYFSYGDGGYSFRGWYTINGETQYTEDMDVFNEWINRSGTNWYGQSLRQGR